MFLVDITQIRSLSLVSKVSAIALNHKSKYLLHIDSATTEDALSTFTTNPITRGGTSHVEVACINYVNCGSILWLPSSSLLILTITSLKQKGTKKLE